MKSSKSRTARWTPLYTTIMVLIFVSILTSIASAVLVVTHKSVRTTRKVTIETPAGPRETLMVGSKMDPTRQKAAIVLGVLGGMCAVAAFALVLYWLFDAWSIVPRKYGGITPIWAVLLLFVPLFNIYWMFRVIPGLSGAYRRVLDAYDVEFKTTGFGAGVTTCVLSLLPGLSIFAPLLFLVWMDQTNAARSRVRVLLS